MTFWKLCRARKKTHHDRQRLRKRLRWNMGEHRGDGVTSHPHPPPREREKKYKNITSQAELMKLLSWNNSFVTALLNYAHVLIHKCIKFSLSHRRVSKVTASKILDPPQWKPHGLGRIQLQIKYSSANQITRRDFDRRGASLSLLLVKI